MHEINGQHKFPFSSELNEQPKAKFSDGSLPLISGQEGDF